MRTHQDPRYSYQAPYPTRGLSFEVPDRHGPLVLSELHLNRVRISIRLYETDENSLTSEIFIPSPYLTR
jgi:hypothetical protein